MNNKLINLENNYDESIIKLSYTVIDSLHDIGDIIIKQLPDVYVCIDDTDYVLRNADISGLIYSARKVAEDKLEITEEFVANYYVKYYLEKHIVLLKRYTMYKLLNLFKDDTDYIDDITVLEIKQLLTAVEIVQSLYSVREYIETVTNKAAKIIYKSILEILHDKTDDPQTIKSAARYTIYLLLNNICMEELC